jgi:hypothetical protein
MFPPSVIVEIGVPLAGRTCADHVNPPPTDLHSFVDYFGRVREFRVVTSSEDMEIDETSDGAVNKALCGQIISIYFQTFRIDIDRCAKARLQAERTCCFSNADAETSASGEEVENR